MRDPRELEAMERKIRIALERERGPRVSTNHVQLEHAIDDNVLTQSVQNLQLS